MISQVKSSNPPPEVIANIPGVELLGKSELRVALLLKIYDIELWVKDKSKLGNTWEYNQPFSISIVYNTSISRQSFVDSTIEQMQKYADIRDKEQNYRSEFARIYKDVKSGDRISAVFIPTQSLTLYLNNSELGKIKDMTFAKQFLDIWLHPNSEFKVMQNELMGRSS